MPFTFCEQFWVGLLLFKNTLDIKAIDEALVFHVVNISF